MADELASQVTVTSEFLSFLDWLTEEYGKQDIRYLLEKPHKWQEEYEEFLREGGRDEPRS